MWPAFAKLIGLNASDVKFINIEPTAKPPPWVQTADVVFELFTGKPSWKKRFPPISGVDHLGGLWLQRLRASYIANADFMKNNPEALRKFLKVSYQGLAIIRSTTFPKRSLFSRKYHPINTDDFIANLTAVKEFFKNRSLQELRSRLYRSVEDAGYDQHREGKGWQ
jgi:hypothetical protein